MLGQNNDVILRIDSLSKSFSNYKGTAPQEDSKGKLQVIKGMSFDVKDGEFITMIGPSGCGKSTLLSLIAGLDKYDSGHIIVNGHRVSSSGPDIIMIFQEDALFPWLTVEQNVEFGLKQQDLSRRREKRQFRNTSRWWILSSFAKSYVHQLSGGMKQRVAIARGLVLNPRILLMDEPFGALDARTREDLQNEIKKIHEKTKKTILFVTHDIREAVYLGDRVILFTRRPSMIKQQYVIDLPEASNFEDPALQKILESILKVSKKKEEKIMANQKQEQTSQKKEVSSYFPRRPLFRVRYLKSLSVSVLEITVRNCRLYRALAVSL